jgi:hypothetical protein
VDGTTDPFELDLTAWPFRRLDSLAAPLTLAPSAIAGRGDQPHNGIGGFFWYLPDVRALATPATLTIRWLDEEVVGLDEGSIRIYEWNPARQDWDLVGGVVDAGGNHVSASISRLGLFTAAPAMPVGKPLVTATVIPAADDTFGVTATSDEIRLNTGALVPDGTLFTVYTVAGEGNEPVQVGSITSIDLDPALEGVQLATVGGRLSLTATIPATFGGARLVAWPAAGGTAFIDAPLAPPEP